MQFYVNSLIKNLPEMFIGKMNVILDGGAFSGSYILGGLYYLKELEDTNRFCVDKMSGCSIGSILCILYKLNRLDACHRVYDNIRKHFKEHGNLHIIKNILSEIKEEMDENFYLKCNDKIFLTYYDVLDKKHIVKSTFINNDDIIDTALKSSYIPYICGETMFHEDRFLDGLKPYDFQGEKSLFFNLCMNYKSLIGMLYIRNEVNNMERTMTGMLETHAFFSNKSSFMCFYTDNMTWMQRVLHFLRVFYIKCIVYGIYICYHMRDMDWFKTYHNVLSEGNKLFPRMICMYNKCFMV